MSTEDQLAIFIARQRLLLAKERDEEISRSSLLLSNCGPKLLEQKGLALNGLGTVDVKIGLGGKTLIELERPTAYHSSPVFPPHTFRPGDLARIEENISSSGPSKKAVKGKKNDLAENKSGIAAEGVVYKVSDTRIVIAIDASDNASDDVEFPERCRVLKLANNVTYDRMEKAMDQLERTVIPSTRYTATDKSPPPQEMTRLVQVLLGMVPPSKRISVCDLKFFDDSLNSSQREAVKFSLESPEVACIHGPPGTGKTHTLIEIIRQLTTITPSNPKPQRLLVCGASNLSVDNILERLLALPPPRDKAEALKVTRIGHPARVMANEGVLESTLEVKASRTDQAALAKDVKNELEATLGLLSGKGKGLKGKVPRRTERRKLWDDVKALRKEYRKREGGVVKSVLGESQVVLATCHTSGGKQLRSYDFDVVIIDEATQALEVICWIPIFKAKKLILAGDPMQLPPTILSINKQDKHKSPNELNSKKPLVVPHKDKENERGKHRENDNSSLELPSTGSDSDRLDSGDEVDGDSSAKVVHLQHRNGKGIIRPPRTLETTLFERLEKMLGPSIKRMLNVQYRMHAQICEFPSKVLYSSKLTSHDSVATHLLRDLPEAKVNSEEDEKELLGTPIIFFDTAGCEYYERVDGDGDEGSRRNENEAAVVNSWVEKLAGAGILPSQIAVITPYQAQVTTLTSILRPVYGPSLEVGTVDGMQGREKDAIVISLVRSNEKREVGFLKDKRRLNVAMTRAKRNLCVVGDSSTVRHGSAFLQKWISWLELNADVRYAGLE